MPSKRFRFYKRDFIDFQRDFACGLSADSFIDSSNMNCKLHSLIENNLLNQSRKVFPQKGNLRRRLNTSGVGSCIRQELLAPSWIQFNLRKVLFEEILDRWTCGKPKPRQFSIYLSISSEKITSWKVQFGAIPHVTQRASAVWVV